MRRRRRGTSASLNGRGMCTHGCRVDQLSIAEGRNRHVVDRFWCFRRGAGVEWGLRIVFDSKLNALGYFGSGDLRGEGEGKVYAGGNAGMGHDLPGGDHELFG
jgi:hypothetical protein